MIRTDLNGIWHIDILWTVDNEIFSLEVNASDQIEMEITLPSGKSTSVTTNHHAISENPDRRYLSDHARM